MERESQKRGREEDNKNSEKKAKKQEVTSFEDTDIFKVSDSFGPLGVFDFPWLKDNPVSDSDDWKFDDVFASSLIDTTSATEIDLSDDDLCQTPSLIEFPGVKLEDELWQPEGDEINGFDCIWSSVLNQPLSIGFRKVSNA